jgi:signal transduction histidine kinase
MTTNGDATCFVIAPIGKSGSPERRRSDQILRYVITPAAVIHGLKTTRADEIAESGLITSQIVQAISGAQMVVADLTGHNPNVFYELAIRHAIRLPYVQIIQKGEDVPFDVAGIRTVFVDYPDLDGVASAVESLSDLIGAGLADPSSAVSPVAVAIDLQKMGANKGGGQSELADIASILSEVLTRTAAVERRLADSNRPYTPEHLDFAAEKELRRLATEFSEFIHDIRVPLTMVAGTLSLPTIPEKQAQHARDATQYVLNRIESLRDPLRARMRIRAGQLEFDGTDLSSDAARHSN